MLKKTPSRRGFIGRVAAAGAATQLHAQPAGRVSGFDHVALPMQNTDAMLAFYRGLGFDVIENAVACSVYIGENMINFHRPATWQRIASTGRAFGWSCPSGRYSRAVRDPWR